MIFIPICTKHSSVPVMQCFVILYTPSLPRLCLSPIVTWHRQWLFLTFTISNTGQSLFIINQQFLISFRNILVINYRISGTCLSCFWILCCRFFITCSKAFPLSCTRPQINLYYLFELHHHRLLLLLYSVRSHYYSLITPSVFLCNYNQWIPLRCVLHLQNDFKIAFFHG